MFDPKSAELHLGILQNRLARIRAKQSSCFQKIEMKENQEAGKDNYPDIDVESEKLKEKALQKEFNKIEKAIRKYEDEVLELTNSLIQS